VRARRCALLLGAAVALAAGLTACSTEDLAFRTDDRVEIVAPHDRQRVRLPVRLAWRSDLGRRPGGPFYAAFVDREPIRPGQSLRVLADDACNRTPRCPDLQYLRDRYVFVTDRESVVLDALPQKGSSQRAGARDRHEATIVLIDADGRRVGESAYTVEFAVREG
jgi:hypothetical protein